MRKYLPHPEKLREERVFAWLGPWARDPRLWHLNRRSTAGGVAIGLLCGLIPGPVQMLGSAILCLTLRVNLPVALVTTLYTNPFTIVPLYALAYGLGAVVLGAETAPPPIDLPHASGVLDYVPALWTWVTGLGPPLAVGLPLLAASLAVLGWFAVNVAWRAWTVRAWRRRARRR